MSHNATCIMSGYSPACTCTCMCIHVHACMLYISRGCGGVSGEESVPDSALQSQARCV